MKLRLAISAFALAFAAPITQIQAADISFAETFALATDRDKALEQLIPGSEDFYYYHCLHSQNTEQWEKVPPLLEAWIARYHRTPRVIEIENRQALLRYAKDPKKTLDLIRERLNLHFSHQREELNKKPNLPTALDPKLVDHDRLVQEAFRRHPNTVSGFEDASIDELLSGQLTPEQRRDLLGRVQVPDHPGLAKLIVADLKFKHSGGFGSLAIHGKLLLSQLDECVALAPELRNNQHFVAAYLQRLWPTNDTNWQQDHAAKQAYLERLWAFVSTLEPVHNSLKAHVLYHRLVLDRSGGTLDAERFLTYLKLPRPTRYIEPKYLQIEANRIHQANLQQDFHAITMLSTVGDDEPLVRSYLDHFLAKAADSDAYKPYILSDYLKHTFAEAKIVRGLGDPETWYSLLPPTLYQQIKDRIDLDFAATNKTEFAADAIVSLDLDIKNVDTLIVKVFEVNTQNYYREKLTEIGPNIDLDGLVAKDEQTYTYKEPPVRRVRRHFEFPKLDARGVYVIDFIGNGKSSRAVIKKGRLRYLVRSSVAGQIFHVYDELNQPVPAANLWLAGNLYTADKDGQIVTPYSNQPGSQPIVLSSGSFSTLERFSQAAEQYTLSAAFHVDREQLLSLRPATVLVRPQLSLAGTPVTPKVLDDITLVITSVDGDDVTTVKEVPDFKLFEDRESTYEFQTPKRLRSITFTLKARVKNLSQNRTQDLAASEGFALNQIDEEDKTEDLHFSKNGENYVVDLLGKSGEAKPDRPVQFTIKVRGFKDLVHTSLQTDARGRIVLGSLPDVDHLSATSPQGVSHQWHLAEAAHTFSRSINGVAGEPVEIPYTGTGTKVARSDVALLEMRGEHFVTDRFENLSISGGLYVANKLPAGDYQLWLKPENRVVTIRLTEGLSTPGFVLGSYRRLQVVNPKPLAIKPVTVGDKTVKIELQNASPAARVHVFVTRFEPAYSAYGDLATIELPNPYSITSPLPSSQYEAGRDIGDELRYIIDRKFTHKFPGNMLERPSLLLNPWAIRKTETGAQVALEGQAFGGEGKSAAGKMGGSGGGRAGSEAGRRDFSDLDFLAHSSAVLLNIAPNDDGIVEIKREELGPRHRITVVAVDSANTASRSVDLPEPDAEYLDLRLAKSLDPQVHFTQQKRITFVPAEGTLVIPDITSARFEVYDNLPRLFSLYATLGSDSEKLAEFAAIAKWPTLSPEAKTEAYKKCASHELHFFLFKKDPDFFKQAVKPYLANKKEKQFMDKWLLEENLDAYVAPWKFAQLNTLERVLLGIRLSNEKPVVARLVREQVDLLPPDRERFEFLFRTALKGTALDTGDAFGIQRELEKKGENGRLREGEKFYSAGGMVPAAPQLAATSAPAPTSEVDAFARSRRDSNAERSNRQLAAGKAKKEMAGEAADELSEALSDSMLADDRSLRGRAAQYYRPLDKTMELVESSYFHVPIDQQGPALVGPSQFWHDVAKHDASKPFVSTHCADASKNLPEMMAALALLDLPFKEGKHTTVFEGVQMTFTAKGPAIVFHEEIQKATSVADTTPILVSQNFYRLGERYRQEGSEQLDKFVTDEFLVHTVYGGHVVVTNPTSSRKRVDVLLQIPQGAMPVLDGQNTKSVHLDLEPYHTQTVEYFFYFPSPGTFSHYPVQVATSGEILAFANPFSFNVVPALTAIDKNSWAYISQYGTPDDVLAFLKANNILQIDLGGIAWRMKDKAFFTTVTTLLAARHAYDSVLWSYGVLHDEPAVIREFLQFSDGFVSQCGGYLDSPLLTIDPVIRKTYEQMDYSPLVNARVGQLGREREILNDRFHAQYERLMTILTYRRQFTGDELMSVTAYLLLQDRIEDALAFFDRVNADELETRLQYDYFSSYLAFSKGEPKIAKTIAAKYSVYPIDRWRLAFASVVGQADEIEAQATRVVDPTDRNQIQTARAASAPAFEFTVDSKKVRVSAQNLREVRVNYYLMDIEVLFSRNPFAQHDSKQFSLVVPNLTQVVPLAEKTPVTEFPLPDALATKNILVEVVGGGITRSQASYSGAMRAQLFENEGQLRVTRDSDAAALPKVYVKVYARMKDGSSKFYKDGYTDLRGRFDYTSLSTDELDQVDRFSLLIMSDDHGAVVREAPPPKQ
jgi:hypothetical protein